MRRLLLALIVPAALMAPRAAHADASVKIGYVDVQRAVQEVDEGKAARARLKTELEGRRGEMEQKRADLEKMKADYDKQAPVLSEEAKHKKQEDMQKAYYDVQQSAQKAQDELTQKEQTAMGSISQRMLQVVADVSEQESLTYVLDKAVILYGPPAADLTNEVVRRYNAKFGGGAATSPAAKKPAGKTPANKTPARK